MQQSEGEEPAGPLSMTDFNGVAALLLRAGSRREVPGENRKELYSTSRAITSELEGMTTHYRRQEYVRTDEAGRILRSPEDSIYAFPEEAPQIKVRLFEPFSSIIT